MQLLRNSSLLIPVFIILFLGLNPVGLFTARAAAAVETEALIHFNCTPSAATKPNAIEADWSNDLPIGGSGDPGAKPLNVDFTVYFKKLAGWNSTVKIHYWNQQTGGGSTSWPGVDMTQCSTDPNWWYFTFTATTSTNLLFHDGNGNQTADLSRSTDGWYDGGWSATPPASFACIGCATDADNDGVCAGTDCNDNDPSVPTVPGTACDDGNAGTMDDVIQADGCTCLGSTNFTVYFKKPQSWSTPVKIHYWERQPGNMATTWPGVNMTLCGNDWWSYTFTSTSSSNLLFNDGNGNQTDDLSRSTDSWYDNGWSATGTCGSATGNVTVTPAIPTAEEPVTVTFDATGSALAGAPQVYFHSGVSVTAASVTSFDRSVGNWGRDDGVGEMTHTGGNNWQITLPSLRAFYGVAATEDVFGMNFLFRSADGTLKEDNSSTNYYNPVNPGDYFTITAPDASPYLAPTGTAFNLVSEASTPPLSWSLEEVDAMGNLLAPLGTQTGGSTYTEGLTLNQTTTQYFRVTANFGSGAKSKTFTAQGYGPICTTARPAWTRPGINYHNGDPTKVTLVLQAPTYTRYKKGTGQVTGIANTIAKNVVHVIGDFNNWTISEAYKLCRDTDGWNGTTDADNDGDHGDYWWIELTGLTPGQEYVFQYLVDGTIQVADAYAEKISDPDDGGISPSVYPNIAPFPSQAGGRRAAVLQTNQPVFNWTAPAFNRPSTNNLNIYELHFRDFTEEGTYLAAIDKLDYLKSLGINAIHVMPVSEFEGNSSWGYNPNFYFAPDKAYGTKADLKKFINACHLREIQVFNDLVLNHAFYSNAMARLYWNKVDNKPANDNPWFNPDHKAVANPAGWWGADWNHESEHTQAMLDRILNYWLQEFKFDGFRFDFTKGFTQTAPDSNDEWASSYDLDRVNLLKRMVDHMWTEDPGSVAIFEHLAEASEDKALADYGILMWSGVGHHNAGKNFMLGYNADNPDIRTTGIYSEGGRNFIFANWMSYLESHDEERQAYEVMNYGNTIATETDPTIKLEKTVDRLKLGASFNLLFPGPRMLWEFEELAYDVSINFNGRTGEKPVHWDYLEDPLRRELFRQTSTLLSLRNTYNLYATPPNYDNIGWGANVITTPRRMTLSDGAGHHVIVIGNLDPEAGHDAYPNYPEMGTWYRYNGDLTIDGTSFTVTNTGAPYYLAPSEVMVLVNAPAQNEVLDGSKVNIAARVLLGGAYVTTSSLMRDDLRALNYIPTTEPYTALGYAFTGGGGGEMVSPTVFSTTGDDAIVDWVVVELRDPATLATVVKSRAALIQRDGDIVALDGTSTKVAFTGVPAGNYYLAIRHRNHLAIATATALPFSTTAQTIDFTKGSTPTWGSNAQKDLGGGKLGLWAGDANRDGQINAVDRNLFWRLQNGQPYSYTTSTADFNLDGAVNAVDRNLYWRINNSVIQQLP